MKKKEQKVNAENLESFSIMLAIYLPSNRDRLIEGIRDGLADFYIYLIKLTTIMKTHIILKGNSQVVKCSFDAINFMAIKSDTPLLLEIPDDADCLYIKGLVKTQRISLEKGKTPNFILIEDRKWAKWISLFSTM